MRVPLQALGNVDASQDKANSFSWLRYGH